MIEIPEEKITVQAEKLCLEREYPLMLAHRSVVILG